VVLAKEFASAKLRNQILVLINLAKARKDSHRRLVRSLFGRGARLKQPSKLLPVGQCLRL